MIHRLVIFIGIWGIYVEPHKCKASTQTIMFPWEISCHSHCTWRRLPSMTTTELCDGVIKYPPNTPPLTMILFRLLQCHSSFLIASPTPAKYKPCTSNIDNDFDPSRNYEWNNQRAKQKLSLWVAKFRGPTITVYNFERQN